MTGLPAGDSLIAPLDMARFALAYFALAIVPGYALARLLRPRAPRIERLALAIPCAYTLVALCGVTTALLHLSFSLPAYAALALPITLAGAWPATKVAWQTTPTAVGRQCTPGERLQTKSPDPAPARWWLIPIGVALAQVGAIVLIYGRDVVPVGSDVVSHVIWTNLIARSHVFPLALLSSHIGATDGGFYPPVFHALTALVLGVTPMATYRAVFFAVLAAIALLPLVLFSYVRAATGSARLGGLAALASLAFEPLPFFVLSEGFYPFIVSLLFAPAIAVALRDGLGRGDRGAVALAALLGVGLFYTHPTELLTAALLTLGVVPGVLRDAGSWVRAGVVAAALVAIWISAAVPVLGAVRHTMSTGAQVEVQNFHDFTQPSHVDLGPVLHGYMYWVYGLNVSYVLLAAVLLGVVWCLGQRRLLGLVAVQAIAFALFVDANSYNLLQRFYTLSYPWVLWERLIATHYWIALPPAAVGIDAALRRAGRGLRTKQAAIGAIIASPLVVIGLLIPLDVAGAHTATYSDARKIVAPADLGTLTWLARHVPAGAVAVNDANFASWVMFDMPIDAGMWLPALDGSQPLIWRQGAGPGPLRDRFYLLRHIADNPLPARVARFIRQYHVRYVFYGAQVRPGATRYLNLTRLLADPLLHLVYSSASTCQDNSSRELRACPASASYVFALRAPRPATEVARQGDRRL